MSERESLRRLIDEALALAAERPWNEISYREIVATAGLRLDEAWRLAPDRMAILDALARQADAAVLAEPAAIEDGTARDRLFDVLMRRFDALRGYRAGLASVTRAAGRDPALALAIASHIGRSMRAMLTAAGLSTEGLAGIVRTKGLAAIWMATFRTFLQDESEDLSETMAALDGRLRRAESLMQRFSWQGGRRGAAPPPDESAEMREDDTREDGTREDDLREGDRGEGPEPQPL